MTIKLFFPVKTVTTIVGQPTIDSIAKLKRELTKNAKSVSSTLGGVTCLSLLPRRAVESPYLSSNVPSQTILNKWLLLLLLLLCTISNDTQKRSKFEKNENTNTLPFVPKELIL